VTLASITFQNYFRLYGKLAGMTGTAMTEAPEFMDIYSLDVVEIPTNMPIGRVDSDDEVYRTADEKHRAIVTQIAECLKKGQPVLVVRFPSRNPKISMPSSRTANISAKPARS